eukprot:3459318-Pyramimonas_sp.AAC.1
MQTCTRWMSESGPRFGDHVHSSVSEALAAAAAAMPPSENAQAMVQGDDVCEDEGETGAEMGQEE